MSLRLILFLFFNPVIKSPKLNISPEIKVQSVPVLGPVMEALHKRCMESMGREDNAPLASVQGNSFSFQSGRSQISQNQFLFYHKGHTLVPTPKILYLDLINNVTLAQRLSKWWVTSLLHLSNEERLQWLSRNYIQQRRITCSQDIHSSTVSQYVFLFSNQLRIKKSLQSPRSSPEEKVCFFSGRFYCCFYCYYALSSGSMQSTAFYRHLLKLSVFSCV